MVEKNLKKIRKPTFSLSRSRDVFYLLEVYHQGKEMHKIMKCIKVLRGRALVRVRDFCKFLYVCVNTIQGVNPSL